MCHFNIPFTGDPANLMNRAKQEITRTGGAFTGDAMNGTFRAKTPLGSIEGSYEIAGHEIALNIIKKPFLLSCRKIEKELRSVMK